MNKWGYIIGIYFLLILIFACIYYTAFNIEKEIQLGDKYDKVIDSIALSVTTQTLSGTYKPPTRITKIINIIQTCIGYLFISSFIYYLLHKKKSI